jgi:signal transduction histidine kinase
MAVVSLSVGLANLVDNSIKYAEPRNGTVNGGPAEIVVRALSEVIILLTVADSGPVSPEADRSRVISVCTAGTESFRNPDRPWLSLASAVARLHGGELTSQTIIRS